MDDITKTVDSVGPVEETIKPEPSVEQHALWNELDATYDVFALEREVAFLELPNESRERISSIAFAEDLGRVAAKFSLNEIQGRRLARIVRYLTIGNIPVSENLDTVIGALGLAADAQESLGRELQALLTPSASTEPQVAEAPLPVDSIVSIPREAEIPVPTPTPPPANTEAQPFMLHEEEPEFTREEPRGGASVTFEPSQGTRPKFGPKPTTAKVEGPGGTRVVHY